MDVKERIEKVKTYFRGMQVKNIDGSNIIYVIVQFPPKWIIDNSIPERFGVSIVKGNNFQGEFYFCAEIEQGFDVVFDAIEYNIEKMLTAQERAVLLKQKIMELQELFGDETVPIESLRNLEFTYKQPKTTKPRKKQVKKEEEIVPYEEEDFKEETE